MTFTRLIVVVRDWRSLLTPEQARMATEGMIAYGIIDWPPEGQPSIDAVPAIAKGELVLEAAASPSEPPSRTPSRPPDQRAAEGGGLMREELKQGPKPESLVRPPPAPLQSPSTR